MNRFGMQKNRPRYRNALRELACRRASSNPVAPPDDLVTSPLPIAGASGVRACIFLLACLSLGGPQARAQVLALGNWGGWAAFGGAQPDGQRVCGIAVRADDRALHVLYLAGRRDFRLELTKRGWEVPRPVQVALSLRAGTHGTATLQGEARPRAAREPPLLVVAMPFEGSAPFWQALRGARHLQVRFATGTEPPWTLPGEGSAAAIAAMVGCLRRMGAPTAPMEDRAAPRPFDSPPLRR